MNPQGDKTRIHQKKKKMSIFLLIIISKKNVYRLRSLFNGFIKLDRK